MTDITENQYDLASQALDAIDAMKSEVATVIRKNMQQFSFLRRHIADMGDDALNTGYLIACVNEQIDNEFAEEEKALKKKVNEFAAFERRVFRQENATRPV